MNALLQGRLTEPGAAIGWPLTLLLIALLGAAGSFAARERAGLAFVIGLMTWASIIAVVGEAWRTSALIGAPLVAAAGIALIGCLAWLTAPVGDVAAARRAWLAPLVLALAAAGFGIAAAPDFFALTVWLAALGAANYALMLAVAPERTAARVVLSGEMLALVTAVGAFAFLARGGPGLSAIGLAAPAALAGAALLVASIMLRIGTSLYALGVAAKARSLCVELALGALGVPILLATEERILVGFAPMLPAAAFAALAAAGGIAMLAGAGFFVAARDRGPRLAWLGASLAGIVLLIIGASGADHAGGIFVELVFVPFAALIAGSSLAESLDARPEDVPAGFGGALEFALGLAALGVIGLPPFAGFWPRLVAIDTAVRDGNLWTLAVIILGSLLLVLGLARGVFQPGAGRLNQAAPARTLEIAAFGLLLGISLAAGLTPRLNIGASQGVASQSLPPLATATEPR